MTEHITLAEWIALGKKRHKFNAIRVTTTDGEKFDSQKEANRWYELKLLVNAGAISNLQRQPSFQLTCSRDNEVICIAHYRADFSYYDVNTQCTIVEDVKGVETPMFQLKRKWFNALYPHLELVIT